MRTATSGAALDALLPRLGVIVHQGEGITEGISQQVEFVVGVGEGEMVEVGQAGFFHARGEEIVPLGVLGAGIGLATVYQCKVPEQLRFAPSGETQRSHAYEG